MASSRDHEIAQLAVSSGKLKEEDLKKCLEEQESLEKDGISMDIEKILRARGLLSAEDIQELKKKLDILKVKCKDCGKIYSREKPPGEESVCEECGGTLEVIHTSEEQRCFENTLDRFLKKGLISDEELSQLRKLYQEGKLNTVVLEERYGGKLEQSVVYRDKQLPELQPVRFGEYKAFFPVGHGRMGVTYKGWKEKTFETFKIKHITYFEKYGPGTEEQFFEKIKEYQGLSHPNLIPIDSYGVDEGRVYLIMPWIDGKSLAKELSEYPMPRSVEEIRAILVSITNIAEALSYLHRHGFVHRNVKPTNIVIKDGYPYLCDFKPSLKSFKKPISEDIGDIYTAPECHQGIIETRSDIYSLGAILYEITTGQPPFTGQSIEEKISKQRTQDPIPPRKINLRIPEALELIITKAMDRSRYDRYLTAEALAQDLNHLLSGEDIKSKPMGIIRKALRFARLYPIRLLSIVAAIFVALLFLHIFYPAPKNMTTEDYNEIKICLSKANELLDYGESSGKIDDLFKNILLKIPKNHRYIIHLEKGKLYLDKALSGVKREDYRTYLKLSLQELQRATSGAPGNHVESLFQLWRCYKLQESDDIPEAEELILKTSENKSENEYTLFAQGYLKSKEAEKEFQHEKRIRLQNEAITLYSKALKINPKFDMGYYERANLYLLQQRYQEALADYNEAISLARGDILPYIGRGSLYCEQKSFAEALTDYNKAISLDPKYAETYSVRGALFKAQKQYDKALEDYNKAIEVKPDSPQFYRYRGDLYYIKKDYQNALDDYTKAQTLNPNDYSIYALRGLIYRELGHNEEALSDFNRSIHLASSNIETYIERGILFRKLGQHQLALSDFNKAIEQNSCFIPAYTQRGLLYQSMKLYAKALEDFEKTIELAPKDPIHYVYRACYFEAVGKNPEAFSDYDKALHIDPNFTQIYDKRGLLYYSIKDYKSAIQDLSKAITLKSQDPRTYFTRGVIYEDQKEHSKALNDLGEAIDINPSFEEAYFKRGRIHQELGHNQEALIDFTNSIMLNMNFADAYLYRGILYDKMGQGEDALKDYTQVVIRQPERAEGYIRRGDLYYKLKEYELAIRDFEKALNLNQNQPEIATKLENARKALKDSQKKE